MTNQHTASPWPGRFWEKTEPGQDGCINWTGAICRGGYGQIYAPFMAKKMAKAHRVAFQLAYGRTPEKDLDHICRNRRCVNVAHLREATKSENMQNGRNALVTACPKGHPYDEANTFKRKTGRGCRACQREAGKRYRVRLGVDWCPAHEGLES